MYDSVLVKVRKYRVSPSTSMISHVRHARQVTFHVFRLEKRILAGEVYLSVSCAPSAPMQYFVDWEVREIVRSVSYSARPVVDTIV
jgi:hypothetical protein